MTTPDPTQEREGDALEDLGHTFGERSSRYDLRCIWCGCRPRSPAAEKKCRVPARWESEG